MNRIVAWWALLSVVGWDILARTAHVVATAFRPSYRSSPAIIEFRLSLTRPAHLTLLKMAIAVTPGSLVLAAARAEDGEAGRIYVHVLDSRGRDAEVAALRDLESRVIATGGSRRPGREDAR